jgi:glycosyltransferase involved in cell wall biosynthesis
MGVPVVGSFHAGIPEAVLDEETGLLAPEGDHTALAQHILRFLEDEPFLRACTARGREWIADRFDLRKQTALLEEIYAATTRT